VGDEACSHHRIACVDDQVVESNGIFLLEAGVFPKLHLLRDTIESGRILLSSSKSMPKAQQARDEPCSHPNCYATQTDAPKKRVSRVRVLFLATSSFYDETLIYHLPS